MRGICANEKERPVDIHHVMRVAIGRKDMDAVDLVGAGDRAVACATDENRRCRCGPESRRCRSAPRSATSTSTPLSMARISSGSTCSGRQCRAILSVENEAKRRRRGMHGIFKAPRRSGGAILTNRAESSAVPQAGYYYTEARGDGKKQRLIRPGSIRYTAHPCISSQQFAGGAVLIGRGRL